MDTLGERIRSIRGKRSREEFSKEYSIHPQSLGRYENGTRTPEDALLDKISNGEDVSFEWIKFGTGPLRVDKNFLKEDLYHDRGLELCKTTQHTKIINSESKKDLYHDRAFDCSDLPRYVKALEESAALQRELTETIRENADLRVELERRKAQIRDLERENADLRKAMKPAHLPGMDGQGVA